MAWEEFESVPFAFWNLYFSKICPKFFLILLSLRAQVRIPAETVSLEKGEHVVSLYGPQGSSSFSLPSAALGLTVTCSWGKVLIGSEPCLRKFYASYVTEMVFVWYRIN